MNGNENAYGSSQQHSQQRWGNSPIVLTRKHEQGPRCAPEIVFFVCRIRSVCEGIWLVLDELKDVGGSGGHCVCFGMAYMKR